MSEHANGRQCARKLMQQSIQESRAVERKPRDTRVFAYTE